MISKRFIFIVSFLIIVSLYCMSAFAIDEQVTDRYPTAKPSPEQVRREREFISRRAEECVNITGFIDEQMGHDNNVELNPNRIKDGFFQTTANIDITYSATHKLHLKAGSDVFNILYFNRKYYNVIDVSPYTGFDYELLPGLISRNRIIYEYLGYPNSTRNTFSGLTLSTYLRHFFLSNTYQEVGYEYLWRWWPKQPIYTYNGRWRGARRGNTDRKDNLYRLKYNFGTFFKRFTFNISNELSRNYSNYVYEQSFDYFIYRLKPSLTLFFTEKIYLNSNFTYRHIMFKGRRFVETSGQGPQRALPRDRAKYTDNYIFTTSLYYNVFKNITFGVTYSYKENVPKDKYYKYSDSVISGGVFYSF